MSTQNFISNVQLDESVTAAAKMNQNTYDELVFQSLKRTQNAARENTAEYERRVPELSRAINKYYKRPLESIKTGTSTSSNLLPTQFIISLGLGLIP